MIIYVPKSYFTVKSINSLFLRNYSDDYFYTGEMHDFWEMVYVEKGKLTVSENEKVYELSAGQAIFHAPMEFHRFWAKKSDSAKFKIISFSLDTNIKHNLSEGVFSLKNNLKEQLEDTYTQIFNGYSETGVISRKESIDPIEETLAIKKLEAFLLSLLSESSLDRTQHLSVTARRYKEVVDFMNDNVNKNFSLDDISQKTHLSTSYLKKLFRTYAGCGAMHYFIRLKIIKSIYYLKRGDSIKEISEYLAFSSPNYYTAVFKREMGMQPTKYRRKAR